MGTGRMLHLINPAPIEPWHRTVWAATSPLLRFWVNGLFKNNCRQLVIGAIFDLHILVKPWCLKPVILRSNLGAGREWVEVSWAALRMGSKWNIGGKVAAGLGLVKPILNERATNDINGANIKKGQQATTVPSQLSWDGTLNNGMIIKFSQIQ